MGQKVGVEFYSVYGGYPDLLHLQSVTLRRNESGRISGREVNETVFQKSHQGYGDHHTGSYAYTYNRGEAPCSGQYNARSRRESPDCPTRFSRPSSIKSLRNSRQTPAAWWTC